MRSPVLTNALRRFAKTGDRKGRPYGENLASRKTWLNCKDGCGSRTLDTKLGPVGLGATYAYVDSTAENGPGDVRELRRPRHLGNVDARLAISPSVSASLGVALSSASLDREFSTWPATEVELDAYRLWRGEVDIAISPRWTLSLSAENLLDTDYVTVYGYRSPGATAMARVVFSPQSRSTERKPGGVLEHAAPGHRLPGPKDAGLLPEPLDGSPAVLGLGTLR